MHNKTILHVSIRCNSPFNTPVYKRLLQYCKKLNADEGESLLRIHIDDFDTQQELIYCQELMYYGVATISHPFNITNSNELYTVLVTLISVSLQRLKQEGFHPNGDSLVISITPPKTDDPQHHVEWSFKM